jgi:hypothetical protein
MTDREKLIMAEAMGALRNIAVTQDGYVARALAHAAIWAMARIAETGEPPSEADTKAFLRSQGFQSGITRSGGN